MIPDIGAPGMNTCVEFIGPNGVDGNFGTDGLSLNNPGESIQVVCVNPSDTAKIMIGPLVVSWKGKLISTQIFVLPDAQPNSDNWKSLDSQFRIPLHVLMNGVMQSNSDTFYIVKPQPAIIATVPGIIGSGGALGFRSRRGAMILDSMILMAGGKYSIDTSDCDAITPGNQGYLPAVILSKGRIDFASSTTFAVDGDSVQGAPGGGGGGGGYNYGINHEPNACGGNGYCGGEGGLLPGGEGTGGFGIADNTRGGISLNGMSGATDLINGLYSYAPGGAQGTGGGSGFPFGTSGQGGMFDTCDLTPCIGGYSGGSGAGLCFFLIDSVAQTTFGGGGAGNASMGTSTTSGGGHLSGNAMLVPLSGGSGGAGGNSISGVVGTSGILGYGGGGGGALMMYSATALRCSVVSANGADGGNMTLQLGSIRTGAGGAGSGGGITLSSKGSIACDTLAVNGGKGGLAIPLNYNSITQNGGDGGHGRIRLDGPQTQPPTIIFSEASQFQGPSTDTTASVSRNFTLAGTGNGEPIEIFVKPQSDVWQLVATMPNSGVDHWSAHIQLPGRDTLYFLAVAQQVVNPDTAQYIMQPSFVLSQAAANILHVDKGLPVITSLQHLVLPRLLCETSRLDTVYLRNAGSGSLVISSAAFRNGVQGFSLIAPKGDSIVIRAGDSIPFVIEFSPAATGSATDTLALFNNDTIAGHNPWAISFAGRKETAGFHVNIPSHCDLGSICSGARIIIDSIIENTGTVAITIHATSTMPNLLSQTDWMIDTTQRVQHVIITFAATVSGDIEDTLIFTDTMCHSKQQIVLRAHVISSGMQVRAMDFGNVCVGDTSTGNTTIYNTGNDTLIITSFAINAPYFVLTPLPISIGPGDSAVVMIQYIPLQSGLNVADADLQIMPCAAIVTAHLAGTGIISRFQTVGSVEFGYVRTASTRDTVIKILNPTFDRETIGLQVSPPFTVDSASVTIEAGSSAIITVHYSPTQPRTDSGVFVLTVTAPCPFTSLIALSGSAYPSLFELCTDVPLTALTNVPIEVTVNMSDVIPMAIDSLVIEMHYDDTAMLFTTFSSSVCMANIRKTARDVLRITLRDCGAPIGIGTLCQVTFLPLVTIQDTTVTAFAIDSILLYPLSDSIHGAGCLVPITVLPVCGLSGVRFTGATSLSQNYPNPFDGVTTLHVTLARQDAGGARLLMYNALGALVLDLSDRVQHDGTVMLSGDGLTAGAYCCILETRGTRIMRQMFVVR